MNKKELSVVVPAYNEALNIPLVLSRFKEVIGDVDAELILVNNGSTDNSQEIIERELKKPGYSFVKAVLVPKNQGYGYGIMFGLKHTQADIVGYTHADMQCDPLDVIRAYKIISKKEKPEKYLVKGWRRKRELVPGILAFFYHTLATIIFFRKYSEINAQPKVFHRSFLGKLKYFPLDTSLDFYILYHANKEKMRFIYFPVNFPDRKHGESKVFSGLVKKIRVIYNFFRYLLRLRFLGEKKASK